MPHQIGQLTSAELDKTIAAAEWLVSISGDGILDRQTWARISTLGADCRAEEEDRAAAAKASRNQAKAALADAPLAEAPLPDAALADAQGSSASGRERFL